ncbi:hypothetical protein AALP_AA7G024200 [Arabis alpina]|uniref:Uncharacterized protein n=1 Tax=Arabis alpina TaxID=50452 RepID=A0A087GFH5_ARAAL|nr:hypothetical protein AALP_AA7G024200 [Arabis alpina]
MSQDFSIPVVEEPHNFGAILSDPSIIFSANLYDQLRTGVFLKPKKLVKYWVDEKNSNCFMLFPRKLSITWSDDPNYWTWVPNEESPKETIEAAELKNVCWLDITGKFDIKNLTPGITYEVVFKVKLEDPAYGWAMPVNVKLVFPNGKAQELKVSLRDKTRYQWFDIRVGEFKAENNSAGEITFSMYEHEAGIWKKGLFLRGVVIRPKQNN